MPQHQPNQKPIKRGGKGFGRRVSEVKPHASVMMRRALGSSIKIGQSSRSYKYWPGPNFLDQGSTPQCVAYSWMHRLLDPPVTYASILRARKTTPAKLQAACAKLYELAQGVDEWPGSAYDGTSVRAGAEILVKTIAKSFGATVVESVLWATTLSELIDAVLFRGPVVMGTNWYSSMMTPDTKTGNIEVAGTIVGGHAYLLNGINVKRRVFRIKNSWGKSWGKNGQAYIGFDDIERLLREDGECAVVQERPWKKAGGG